MLFDSRISCSCRKGVPFLLPKLITEFTKGSRYFFLPFSWFVRSFIFPHARQQRQEKENESLSSSSSSSTGLPPPSLSLVAFLLLFIFPFPSPTPLHLSSLVKLITPLARCVAPPFSGIFIIPSPFSLPPFSSLFTFIHSIFFFFPLYCVLTTLEL